MRGSLTNMSITGAEVLGGDQNIEVTHGRAHPSQAAGWLRVHDSFHALELFDDLHRQRIGPAQWNARRPARERGNPFQDGSFRFFAHARQVAQLSLFGGGFQFGKGGDAKRLPDHGGALGPEAWDGQPLRKAWRDFLFEPFQESQLAGLEQLVDLFGNGFAHARDLLQLSLFPILTRLASQAHQALGGLAIGERLVHNLALDLQ